MLSWCSSYALSFPGRVRQEVAKHYQANNSALHDSCVPTNLCSLWFCGFDITLCVCLLHQFLELNVRERIRPNPNIPC